MKKFIFMLSVVLMGFGLSAQAQDVSKEELKAERQQLKEELSSKAAAKADKDFEDLVKSQPSSKTGNQTIDGLLDAGCSIVNTTVGADEFLSDFKRNIVEGTDGDTYFDNQNPDANSYVELTEKLAAASMQAAEASKQLQNVQDEIKKLNPIKAKKTISAANWAIKAIKLGGERAAIDVKLIKNLAASVKAQKNQ